MSDAGEGDSKYEMKSSNQLNELVESLHPYKEVIVKVQDFMLWQETYYAYIIAGVVTLQFVFAWYFELTFLSTLSIILAKIALIDYLAPKFGSKLMGGQEWNPALQSQFVGFCNKLIAAKQCVCSYWSWSRSTKANHPTTYTIGLVCLLFVIGMIGYYVDNTFLLFLIYLSAALAPGLLHHGYLQRWITEARQQFDYVLRRKSKTN